jgi:hypothetical protein
MATGITPTARALAALVFAFAVFTVGEAAAQYGGARRGSESKINNNRPSEVSGEGAEVTRLSANDQFRLRLTSVGLALKLTPDQKASWQAYEDKVLRLLSGPSEPTSTSTGDSALTQIDQKVGLARTELAAMQALSDAARKLYAILSEDQKIVADRMLAGTVPAVVASQKR